MMQTLLLLVVSMIGSSWINNSKIIKDSVDEILK